MSFLMLRPGHDRVRCDDRRDLLEQATAESLALHGEPPAFFIGEAESLSAEIAFKNAVFCDKIVDDILLMPMDPAGNGEDEELPRLNCGHARRW